MYCGVVSQAATPGPWNIPTPVVVGCGTHAIGHNFGYLEAIF
jgi:hypothetical protein